jgi:hypothetical protein
VCSMLVSCVRCRPHTHPREPVVETHVHAVAKIPKRYSSMPSYRRGTGFVVRNRPREARGLMPWRGYRRGTVKSRYLRGNVLGTVEGGTDAAA